MEDNTPEWSVKKILSHHRVGRESMNEGDREIDATWQPRRNFLSLQAYDMHEKEPKKQKTNRAL